MTAPLHTALVAALDAEERDWLLSVVSDTDVGRAGLRRVRHQRNVLARHAVWTETRGWTDGPFCRYDERRWPCPDIVDLAGMLDVEVPS